MDEKQEKSLLKQIKEIVVDINPDGVFRDARGAGLEVLEIEDFRKQTHNYWRIEDLMHQYAGSAARYSAISGATAGIGGPVTAVTLGGVDIANMAAQLYRLSQRLAILNGFDPENPLQREKTHELYLYALGFDAAAQAAIKQQMTRAAGIAGKRGAYSNPVLKLIVIIAEKLGAQITSKQAAKFIPIVGGAAGATVNYTFARSAGNKMLDAFKKEYFRTWQATTRNGN
ncbi:MAG: EcsC family protein [Gracilimonas sp.]